MYCGTDLKNSTPDNVTLDHLVPRNKKVAHGSGGNEATNLITCCKRCNSSRQDRPYTEFAPGGSLDRIEIQRHLPLNVKLAAAIINGTAGDPEVESLR